MPRSIIDDLVDRGVSRQVASAYAAATSTTTIEGKVVTGATANLASGLLAAGQNANTGTTPTNQIPPGTGTGSSGASSGGYTTTGPAGPGQSGYGNTPTGGTSTGGGGGTPPPNNPGPTNPPLDWQAYLSNWGFTQDIIDTLTKIFSTYTDPSLASAAALAYIRGTDWYAQTFPGIQTGEKLGLFNDEQGYRSYLNQVNGLYQSYYGRAVTTNELLDYLNAGRDSNYVGQHLSGQAILTAQKPDIEYELGAFDAQGRPSDSDLSQYGDYLGGIGNQIGPQLQQRIAKTQARMNDLFQSTLANPSLSMASGRLIAPSLGNATSVSANKTPDIPS